MYRCHIHFYLVGHRPDFFEPLKRLPPLEHFTHTFTQSREPDAALAGAADVILADLRGLDASDALAVLAGAGEAERILIVEKEQIPQLTDWLEEVWDLWTAPLSEEELRFRFLRWQRGCKGRKDAWQTAQYLEATINSVPNLVWYKDKDGVHEKVNDSFCKTVNKTKAQVEGRRHAYIWDVERDDPACIESEAEVMLRRETCVSEEQVQTGEGTRLLTTYKSPLYDLDGSVMGTLGVAIDVTQERAYEQEILQKNNMLESIFTALDCGVICHTLDGTHILRVNQAALNILGYTSQDELTRDGFYLVAPSVMDEDKEKVCGIINSLQKEGDSASTEYRVRHSDGGILHIMGNFKLVRENGEIYVQRLLLDFTAQENRAQEELAKSQRQQAELVHALSIDYSLVCFFNLDTDQGFPLRMDEETYPALADVFSGEILFGRSMERYIAEFVYEEDRDLLRQSFSRENLLEELDRKQTYYVNFRALIGGEVRYHQIKVVRTGAWSVRRGIVLGFRNVDEETRRELEKKTLLEGALLQAKRASKAKSTFLSNMSHDIRTPMNAIVGFTSLAISHIDRREQVEEYLKKIMTSGNHLLSLINDILDMSRIESGKIHLDEEACSLPEVLHSLRSIIQADVHAKQLDLYVDAVDVLDEEVYCDKLRLSQVLLNLTSNSIKYTGAGGKVGVRIAEKPGSQPGFANFEFTVWDTGIGMSEEFVAHIFEPFERERNSTTSGIQGTGLGMAITRNIVDMMNGDIKVHSKQGEGTEVTVCFPFRLRAEEKANPEILELTDQRALVVDDDFNTCDSVSYMLQQIGMRAEWTLSGKEAVLRTRQAVARKDSYSVYIIDWLIPDMNGIEVARRIRQEIGGDAPIVVMTAYDWSDIEEEAREAGVTVFCSKPLFLSELRRCLHTLLHQAEEQAAAQAKPKKRHTGRLLLAEDNALNQEIAVAILEEAGFSVEIAENGQLAVDKLKASEPGYYRMVLMDIQMPVMGGYEATRLIRGLETPALAGIPILAMTANAFEEDRQEALRCGMNGHIAKPIDIETLLKTLDEILD